jgi:response regulator RpfG family c-di-GMP phosphodiesterase
VSAEPPLSGTDEMGGSRSVTVLVADDNEVALRLCRRVLEKAGYKVLTASDAREAMSLALANSPDMILLDHAMPGMDSLEAMRQIKQQRPGIAIVIASVLATTSDRERYLAAGADDVMFKPFRLSDLIVVAATLTANRALHIRDLTGTTFGSNEIVEPLGGGGMAGVPIQPYPSADWPEDLEINESVAKQAAIPLHDKNLLDSIESVLDGFVRTSLSALELRDPSAAGRSYRVEALTTGLAREVSHIEAGKYRDVRLTEDQFKELRYACLLHDVGLIGVPEHILIKAKKLFPGQLEVIQARFDFLVRSVQVKFATEKLEVKRNGKGSADRLEDLDRRLAQEIDQLHRWMAAIVQANEPSALPEDTASILEQLSKQTFHDLSGTPHPMLDPQEFRNLSIRKGVLDPQERLEMESHVTQGFEFVSKFPWPPSMRNIPEIVYTHHERLDGSGYPRGLSGDQISLQTRMLMIADIYDALTAHDRPYKRAVPTAVALEILRAEANDGKLDKDLFDIFVTKEVFLTSTDRPAAPVQKRDLTTDVKRQTVLKEPTLDLAMQALDARDPYTASHSSRVSELAALLGEHLGLGDREVELLRTAGSLHDLGMIGVRDDVLNKPGSLNDKEWEVMRRHPDIGADMVAQHPALAEVATLVRHHHERWDGTGYPAGLRGDVIPFGARILAVADSFDAITSPRIYTWSVMTPIEAVEDISRRANRWYDPDVVNALCEIHGLSPQ